jgi:cytochrome c biogenesis protein CcdA/thiol-disulfide isomerase/thioredoxin
VIVLLLVGFLAGLVTGISPCILPVLPVIFASGAASGLDGPTDGAAASSPAPDRTPVAVGAVGGDAGEPSPADPVRPVPAAPTAAQVRLEALRRRRRPFAVVAGLVVSFSVVTLLGTWLLGALGLPLDLLRWLGIALVAVLGLGLLVPALGELLERPFARLSTGRQVTEGGGFVLGLSLGLVFVPCAGPVLATISVVGNDHHIDWSAVLLTASFAVGVAVPLLLFALAGQFMAVRMGAVRAHAATARRVIGAVLVATALVLASNVTDGIQRALPGYTDALTQHLEANGAATRALDGVRGIPANRDSAGAAAISGTGSLASCTDASPVLQMCGPAPQFSGINRWLDTPGDRPLSIAGLRGHVVLVDFWTYSCINCQRSLPHVEAWNAAYAKDGLVVVGVHTPEFAFEHVVSNITQAATQLGVHYPIAVDNDDATWNNYQNNSWPAEFLIDATGTVRHVDFGEGQYAQSETFIRQLLVAAHPTVSLPPRTDVPDTGPQAPTTPESYLGYDYNEANLAAESILPDSQAIYTPPSDLPQDTFAFGGGWKVGPEGAVAGTGASIQLRFEAQDVYLVLGGSGTVTVDVDGSHTRTVAVTGEPKLYQLVGPGPSRLGLLNLSVPPGVEAYDFTFG